MADNRNTVGPSLLTITITGRFCMMADSRNTVGPSLLTITITDRYCMLADSRTTGGPSLLTITMTGRYCIVADSRNTVGPSLLTIAITGRYFMMADSRNTVGPSLLTITITVADSRNAVGPSLLTITITDINDPVHITNLPSSVTVTENVAVGTSLFDVTYTDVDVTQTHSIAITSANPASGTNYFVIDPSTGIITTSSVLNYETLPATTFTFDVTVSDPVTSDMGTLTIYVANENEAPAFGLTSYTLSATEGNAWTVIGTPSFGVTDPDSGETARLTMNCGTETGYFHMDPISGQVSYQSDYDLDLGTLPTTVSCTVTVTDSGNDANDNVPTFSPTSYSFYVSYYADAGTTLGYVTATDGDAGPNGVITFTLNQTSLGDEFFAIDSSGAITLKGSPSSMSLGYGTSVTVTSLASDVETTTTTTTTTTDRYRTFTEDSKNVAWVVAAGIVAIACVVAAVYVLCTCHGENGCGQFMRTCHSEKTAASKM
ncbi:FAT4-like protein [Mya arenaria]|uniref:FAT4-like protein n=1 Tax=Mya arenaria TaxID=6604 RepID=A0ABY7EWW1_MYAAR|nr:FAT4-like protein [Mya arenaria]